MAIFTEKELWQIEKALGDRIDHFTKMLSIEDLSFTLRSMYEENLDDAREALKKIKTEMR